MIDHLSYERLVRDRRVLHFAPEDTIGSTLQDLSTSYTTADFLDTRSDLKIDISSMPLVDDESFDTVIAFDVLEHVPGWRKAVKEVHRILSDKGWAILAVPQKDGLLTTYEEPSITSRKGRTEHFGQWDHLRIFGQDFPSIVGDEGFVVTTVSESCFPAEIVKRHVLFPPVLSSHPLATNRRSIFFCQKI